MRFIALISYFVLFSTISCGGNSADGGDDQSRQGGDTTTENRTSLGFEDPAVNLSSEQLEQHLIGDVAFEAKFVSSPAPVNPGLGPIFNNSSCAGCHTKNGRGGPVFGQSNLGSQAVVRISNTANGEVPGLGFQVQDHAIFGATSERKIELQWQTVSGSYSDGESYQLRKPILKFSPNLPNNTQVSLRTAPPVFGLGLLEAIPEESIRALADPEDSNADGISGRTNNVLDFLSQSTMLGRFGRKANQPNLLQQTARAYFEDIGITNPVFTAANGSSELDTDTLTAATFYVQSIAVPRAATTNNPTIVKGEALFHQVNCSGCHVQKHITGEHELDAVSNQTIYPYTDLLLHDMGNDLADDRPDFEANGNEWRTSPLWGIGLAQSILGSSVTFLHDGRAQSIEEAILWHGGEALNSREAFRTMSKEDRDALLAFLHSL